MERINGVDVAEFISGYITAMLWSSHDESNESGGRPMDANYSEDDLTDDARERCEVECKAFLYRVGYMIDDEQFTGNRPDGGTLAAYAGHDFWLTRNGHGAGFWDGDWAETADKILTGAAKAFGELNPYVTEGGQIDI